MALVHVLADVVAAPSARGTRWRERLRLRPGWPLTAALVGYPVWWVLGIAGIVPVISAVLMALELVHDRDLRVRRSFGLLLLFVCWVLIGALVLQVNAVGAEPGSSATRYLTFTYRVAWYLTAITALVYVYNRRAVLSTQRIVRAFSVLFLTVVVGGVVGTLAYGIEFPSLVEMILPRAVTHQPFVHDIVHPTLAQIYTDQGFVNPRASAPFAYTNDWGLNFVCLLPFFLVGWLGRDAGWRRRVAPFVLIVAAFPVVETQNRGAWITLTVLALLYAARELVFGRLRAVAAVGVVVAGIAALLLATPLGSTIEQRFTGPTSNQGRSSLGQRTVESVLDTAPVIGVGSTRNVQGALYSIAGGDSAACHNCSPPALGTQGHFWLLIYSTGIGGAALYLGFLVTQLFRYARLRSSVATLGLSLVVVQLTTMFVYDAIDVALLTIFVGVGLLWREARADELVRGALVRDNGEVALRAYARFARANRVLIAVCVVAGAAGGLAYDATQGHPTVATAEFTAPVGPDYSAADVNVASQSLDTVAQLVNTPSVVAAVSRASGESVTPGPKRLWVTATANTRLLQVHFAAASPGAAGAGATAGAQAMLAVRRQLLARTHAQVLAGLVAERTQLVAAAIAAPSIGPVGPQRRALSGVRTSIVAQISDLTTRIAVVEASGVDAGAVTGQSYSSQEQDRTLVYVASGIGLGLVLAVLVGLARRGAPARRLRDAGATPTGPRLRRGEGIAIS